MRAKRKVFDGSNIRRLIAGLITSADFCKALSPVLKNNLNLLEVPFARTVAGWCIEHFEKYGSRAPYGYIKDIFEKEEHRHPDDSARLVEEFLSSLSEEHEQTPDFNPQYEIAQAIDYLRKRSLELHEENIHEALSRGDTAQAEEIIQNFKTIAPAMGDGGMTGEELLEMEITDPEWLLEGFIPTGLTILAGKSKIGKSTFALNAAIAIARGRMKAFGEFRGRRGRVLYLSLEDGKRRLQERTKNILPEGSKAADLNNLYIHYSWPKLSAGGLQHIEDWLKDEGWHRRLVVIDVFEKVRSRSKRSGNGNLYAEDYEAYGPLADLCKRHGVSILLLTHTTKTPAADVFDQILGSMGTQGAADTLMVITNHPMDRNGRTVSIRGKDVEERHLAFTPEGFRWIYQGDAEYRRLSRERHAIMGLLEQMNEPMSTNEIRQALEHTGIKSIKWLLRELAQDGEIEHVRHGVYASAGWTKEHPRRKMRVLDGGRG